MTIKEALKAMDMYYHRLCNCTTTAGRKYNGNAMYDLLEEVPELNKYWKFDGSYLYWVDKFEKIANFNEEDVVPNDYTIKNYGKGNYKTITDNIFDNYYYYVNHYAKNKSNIYDDGINFDLPEKSGCYMIGEITYNPQTKKFLYGIKIGLGSNLKKRIASYKTCGSTPYVCDYLLVPNDDLDYVEKMFHLALKGLCIAMNKHNKEWFFFDEETYLDITSKGFSYFNK